jgi:hypothetical protein
LRDIEFSYEWVYLREKGLVYISAMLKRDAKPLLYVYLELIGNFCGTPILPNLPSSIIHSSISDKRNVRFYAYKYDSPRLTLPNGKHFFVYDFLKVKFANLPQFPDRLY